VENGLHWAHRWRGDLPESSQLLIVERIIPEDGSAILPILWDLHLLMMAGGRMR
jgi:hypothetical protein